VEGAAEAGTGHVRGEEVGRKEGRGVGGVCRL